MASDSNKKTLIHTGTLSAGLLLMLALLAIVNYFGWKYHHRFDLTRSRIYTLSETSLNVLKKLDRDVEAVVLLSPQDRQIYDPVKELLDRYAAASPRFKVRHLDLEKNPREAQQLVQKYGIKSAGVVIASGNDRRAIDKADLADFDFSGMQMGQAPQMTGFKGEQLFTGALVQMTEGHKPKILFTTGHGEASLDDQNPTGLSTVPEILGRDNYNLEEWASLGKPAVPDGTDLLVIPGPKSSFLQPELDAISAYLAKGGRVLLLLDPVLGQGTGLVQTGFGPWLQSFGVRLGDDIVVDPSNPLPFFGPETIFAKSYGEHPTTKPLQQAGLPVLLTLARSVGKAGEGNAAYDVTSLVETSPAGWGETNLSNLNQVGKDAADLAGPVSLGVVVTPKGAGAEEAEKPEAGKPAPSRTRLVVVGDSDFANNQLLRANEANSVLVLNLLNWLVERDELVGIPPKKTEQTKLTLTDDQLKSVWLLIAMLPLFAITLGVWMHLKRRR